jgi:hypothetical protein
MPGIVLVQGRRTGRRHPGEGRKGDVPILVSDLSGFETAGKIYAILSVGES